jgi:flavin reductase ActVB
MSQEIRLSEVDRAPDLAEAFRRAMGQLAAGVVMVTTWLDGKAWGLTISSCCSVSLAPPTVLISLGANTASAASIAADGVFGVSLLGSRHQDAARAGATKGQPKFVDRFCHSPGEQWTASSPALKGALAHLDCRASKSVEIADHTVFFGEVERVVLGPGDEPLLYYARGYAQLASEDLWYC